MPPDRSHDVFISYAHADDEVPVGAASGWVTTLIDELKKVLRRKLGGAGADIWMDHQLAGNERVSDTLLARLRGSRTLLLVMSPGYQGSSWCQRELVNFLTSAASRESRDSVFVIEVEPVRRENWHPALQELTPIRFWDRQLTDPAPRLLGYPVPKSDESNPYWYKVNELAHLIARQIEAERGQGSESRGPIAVLAETTDDLLDERDSLAAFLRQAGCESVPASQYPRDSEPAFLDALRRDLARAALFVQLLGPHEGRVVPGGDISFVALQAREAVRAKAARGLPVFQWRSAPAASDPAPRPAYRELLGASDVRAGGLEEFKKELLAFTQRGAPASTLVQPTAPAAGPLRVCVSAHERDRSLAVLVSHALADLGVAPVAGAEPDPDQAPGENRLAQSNLLERCHGVVIIYGQSAKSWVASQFMLAGKVMAKRSHGVWGTLLSAPPADKPLSPVRSAALMPVDCRAGFDPALLGGFVQALRAGSGGGGV